MSGQSPVERSDQLVDVFVHTVCFVIARLRARLLIAFFHLLLARTKCVTSFYTLYTVYYELVFSPEAGDNKMLPVFSRWTSVTTARHAEMDEHMKLHFERLCNILGTILETETWWDIVTISSGKHPLEMLGLQRNSAVYPFEVCKCMGNIQGCNCCTCDRYSIFITLLSWLLSCIHSL